MPFDGPRQEKIRVAVVPNRRAAPAPCRRGAVRKAADALSDAGYDVSEVVPPQYEEILGTGPAPDGRLCCPVDEMHR